MERRRFLQCVFSVPAASLLLPACSRGRTQPRTSMSVTADSLRVHAPIEAFKPLDKPLSAWREILTKEEFHILFEAGTEPRYSSPLLEEKRRGTYICAACRLPLFPSTTKFESGTGWPSFWAPLKNRLETKRDTKLAMTRTEYHCARCGGHQGHVFEDGPDPTGLRYCNDGLALDFVPEDTPLPPLRS